MAKIKIEDGLLDRAKRIATIAGYSDVEEFSRTVSKMN